MNDAKQSDNVVDLFTKGTHAFLFAKTLFLEENMVGPFLSTRIYVVLFKNPRDSRGVRSLMEQAFPANLGYAMDSYAQAINDKPFSYLFLDLHQQTPDDYRLRTNVLPFELPHYCFIPTK